ncbi:MAG: type II toxin-antitoxin system VapC family toxin [Terriglobales bacterium]
MRELRALDLVRHPHAPMMPRIWSLRHAVSAYDAAYVALAKRPGARLLTCDRRLTHAPEMRATVEVVRAA